MECRWVKSICQVFTDEKTRIKIRCETVCDVNLLARLLCQKWRFHLKWQLFVCLTMIQDWYKCVTLQTTYIGDWSGTWVDRCQVKHHVLLIGKTMAPWFGCRRGSYCERFCALIRSIMSKNSFHRYKSRNFGVNDLVLYLATQLLLGGSIYLSKGGVADFGRNLGCDLATFAINAMCNCTTLPISTAQMLSNTLISCINSINNVIKLWKFMRSDRWCHDLPPTRALWFFLLSP